MHAGLCFIQDPFAAYSPSCFIPADIEGIINPSGHVHRKFCPSAQCAGDCKGCCNKIAEAEAAVSVNEKKWLVMLMHMQLKLDELRGPPNPWLTQ
jgi:hypothetical protein